METEQFLFGKAVRQSATDEKQLAAHHAEWQRLAARLGMQLTIEGERLFEHRSIAIEQLVSGENELLKDKGLESGLVNIGASEIALRLFLLNELEVFPSPLSTCKAEDF